MDGLRQNQNVTCKNGLGGQHDPKILSGLKWHKAFCFDTVRLQFAEQHIQLPRVTQFSYVSLPLARDMGNQLEGATAPLPPETRSAHMQSKTPTIYLPWALARKTLISTYYPGMDIWIPASCSVVRLRGWAFCGNDKVLLCARFVCGEAFLITHSIAIVSG